MMKMNYKRILIKISGESLANADQSECIHIDGLRRIIQELVEIHGHGTEIALVVGGGNIWRGATQNLGEYIDRASSDHIGMMATVMNAIALQSALSSHGLPSHTMSAVEVAGLCPAYNRRQALTWLQQKHIVIFAAGTGTPFFTTDTAAVLRAIDLGCDAMFKGTKVNGVYSDDPIRNPNATFYDRLDYQTVLSQNLKVMDMTAILLAQEHCMPLVVFSMFESGAFKKVLTRQGIYTIISNEPCDFK